MHSSRHTSYIVHILWRLARCLCSYGVSRALLDCLRPVKWKCAYYASSIWGGGDHQPNRTSGYLLLMHYLNRTLCMYGARQWDRKFRIGIDMFQAVRTDFVYSWSHHFIHMIRWCILRVMWKCDTYILSRRQNMMCVKWILWFGVWLWKGFNTQTLKGRQKQTMRTMSRHLGIPFHTWVFGCVCVILTVFHTYNDCTFTSRSRIRERARGDVW